MANSSIDPSITNQVDCSGEVPLELSLFFDEQMAWSRSNVKDNPDDPYWQALGAILAQLDGLQQGMSMTISQKLSGRRLIDSGGTTGYHAYAVSPLPSWAFTMLNALGDLFDVQPAVIKVSLLVNAGMSFLAGTKTDQSYTILLGQYRGFRARGQISRV